MLYELRIYDIAPNRMPAIVNRFVNTTLALFKKHEIKPVLFLEPVIGVSNQLTYLLEWESLEQRERRWDAFTGDPVWQAARAESEKDGPIAVRVNNSILKEVPAIAAKMKDLGF
jgi:hypothetical protein